MLITSLDYSSYVGRIAVGRVHRGTFREGQEVALCKRDGSIAKMRIKEVNIFEVLAERRSIASPRATYVRWSALKALRSVRPSRT